MYRDFLAGPLRACGTLLDLAAKCEHSNSDQVISAAETMRLEFVLSGESVIGGPSRPVGGKSRPRRWQRRGRTRAGCAGGWLAATAPPPATAPGCPFCPAPARPG